MIPKEDENSDVSDKNQDSFMFIKQALDNLLMSENDHTKNHVLLDMKENEKTFNQDEIAVKENETFEAVKNNEMNDKNSTSLVKNIDDHEEDGILSGRKLNKKTF